MSVAHDADFKNGIVVEAKIIEGRLRLTYRYKRLDRTFHWEFKDPELRNRLLDHFNNNRCRTLDQILCEGFDWKGGCVKEKTIHHGNMFH